jgi:hypothetical protein
MTNLSPNPVISDDMLTEDYTFLPSTFQGTAGEELLAVVKQIDLISDRLEDPEFIARHGGVVWIMDEGTGYNTIEEANPDSTYIEQRDELQKLKTLEASLLLHLCSKI